MVLESFLTWLPMLPLAILNGVVREKTYGRRIGELRAHQVSTLSAALLFAGYTGALQAFWPLQSDAQALSRGLVWLLLTVLFEFGFGRAAGHAWQRLLHDYDLRAGRVWSLLLLWLAAAPWLLYRLLG
ncbi:MAG TPA: hypothetical protein PKH28_10560 [Candidatus Competibacteraceae bacterium]|jgi:hypothetical protein|nr:hypothetical protein [Candidatus Competibacteraceae bacterium]